MTHSPLLPFENRIIGTLATMNQCQAARYLGMCRNTYLNQIKAILRRIEQAGGDTAPLRQTIGDWHHRTRTFSRLRGRQLEQAKTVIDGNELVREQG